MRYGQQGLIVRPDREKKRIAAKRRSRLITIRAVEVKAPSGGNDVRFGGSCFVWSWSGRMMFVV